MNEAVYVIDKVPGPTSFEVVKQVRQLLGGVKLGHAGSLDPFASGVLILLAGKATKLSNLLLNADKRYRGIIRLGAQTDTMDLKGQVTVTADIPPLDEQSIRSVFSGLQGTWEQVPPIYSAKKIRGVRLYKLARQNIHIRRTAEPVQLHRLELLSWRSPDIEFELDCSKGTYVRALAEEIGKRLGTVAHLHALRRLACGTFTLDQSVSVEQFELEKPKWSREGYENYVKLLKSESLAPSGSLQRGGRGLPSAQAMPKGFASRSKKLAYEEMAGQ